MTNTNGYIIYPSGSEAKTILEARKIAQLESLEVTLTVWVIDQDTHFPIAVYHNGKLTMLSDGQTVTFF